jgi:hypothetical protein
MIIKSNTIFFIYTIVINDSKVFINKTIQKEAKRQGKRVALIRDRLYIESELYVPAEEIDEAGAGWCITEPVSVVQHIL